MIDVIDKQVNNTYKFYKLIQDINSQATFKYSSKRKGIFALTCLKPSHNHTYWGTHLLKLLRKVYRHPLNNWYLPPNTFWTYDKKAIHKTRSGRKMNNIHTMTCFFLDFDVLNALGFGHHPHNAFERQCNRQWMKRFRYDLPDILHECNLKPTAIINSGHGYHAYFCLNRGVVVYNTCMVKLWHRVQEAIIKAVSFECFLTYGSRGSYVVDPKVSNVNRILRVAGSLNMKARPLMVTMDYLNTDNLYSFSSLCHQWLKPLPKNTGKRKHYRKHPRKLHLFHAKGKIKQYRKYYHHKHGKHGSVKSLHYLRGRDLYHLIIMRNHEGCLTGYREELLFLYKCNDLWLKDGQGVINDLVIMNNTFAQPLNSTELRKVINEDIDKYFIPSKTFIDLLNISSKEQRNMKTIMNSHEAKNRYQQRLSNRKSKRKPAVRKHKQALKERNQRMYNLHLQGKSYNDISKITGKSRSTILRAIKSEKSEKPMKSVSQLVSKNVRCNTITLLSPHELFLVKHNIRSNIVFSINHNGITVKDNAGNNIHYNIEVATGVNGQLNFIHNAQAFKPKVNPNHSENIDKSISS